MSPSEGVFNVSLLNPKDIFSDRIRDRSGLQFLVNVNWDVFAFKFDIPDRPDNNCSACAKALQKFPFFTSLDDFVNGYDSLFYGIFRMLLQIGLSLIQNYNYRISSNSWQNQILQ